MITFIEGVLEESGPLSAIVNVGGIGYQLHIPVTTAEKLPSIGSQVKLFTHAVYREDSQALYGFLNRGDREFFQLLTEKVSGVGPKIALNILSRLSVEMLHSAIASGDAALLAKCQGIGRKTAERLCMELRDHMPKGLSLASGSSETTRGTAMAGSTASAAASSTIADAVAALMQLGYKLDVADKAVRKSVEKLGTSAATESLIREALR